MNPKFNNKQLIENLKSEESNTTNSYHEDNKRRVKEKMMKSLYKIAIFTVILVVVLFVLSLFTPKKKNHIQVEDIMKSAATKYYNQNSSELPKVNGGTVEISVKKLSNLKYMKDISKYLKDDSCTGKVVVENNDDSYVYIPYLDCGSKYKTTELFREITKNDNIVTTGNGLYRSGHEYIYKGDAETNYVSINNNLWRIVKVTYDNEVMLIKQDKLTTSLFQWDNRYNSEKKSNLGINEFKLSRMKDILDELYDKEYKQNGKLFTNSDKQHIVSHNYCIGKREVEASSMDNSIECSEQTEKIKMGLLTVSDFINASLDSNCNNTISRSCQNYNYLVLKRTAWWLITAPSNASYKVFVVNSTGFIEAVNASNIKAVRPVIYLNSKTMYKSGSGTQEDPYILK